MFVADCGLIWMFASTQVLVASAQQTAVASPASRRMTLPLPVTSVAALIVLTPAVVEVQVTVQEPVARIVWQVPDTRLNVPAVPLTLVKVILLPPSATLFPYTTLFRS